MPIKLSDFVVQFVASRGVGHVFLVPGGGAMHLDDSVAGSGLEFVANQHEQACAIAAEAYAKVRGGLGFALVTAGPGATNTVTGVAGAWLDSTPVLFVSGQVKRSDLCTSRGVRSYGVQEVDIVSIVRPITKYAVLITDPKRIRFELEKAVHLATTGRPGPVWLDIPLDVQAAQIEPDALEGFAAGPEQAEPGALAEQVSHALELLAAAERPVLLLGNGVRLARAQPQMRRVIERLGIPVLLTWHSIDLLPDDHPLFAGRPGLVAPRGANFTLQNSDLLISVGARLDLVLTGYAPDRAARAAKRVIVDVDPAELAKNRADLAILADAGRFLDELQQKTQDLARRDRSGWLARTRAWRTKYPVVLDEHRRSARLSVYAFTEALCDQLGAEVVVSGCAGAAIEIFLLAYRAKEGQRLVHTTGLGAMGYGLPLAIGACLAAGRAPTVVVKGDGGLQFNVQELETIRRLALPIKIFVLANEGYSSIRTSQSRHFGRLLAADATSGLTLPPADRLAAAYGLPFVRLDSPATLQAGIADVLGRRGPVLCEVVLIPDEVRAPSLAARQRPDGSMWSPPLEDLSPPLSREELRANMLIPLVEEAAP